MNNLRRLDLNLLVTLDVLLSEHNVTRAAERLNLSQPSVSVHLAKLRDVFGDPLLLPGPRGMQPTARANELREPLRLALEGLGRAVAPAAPFDPFAATNTWRIGAADYGEATIVLPALKRLRIEAPQTRLAILDLSPSHVFKQAEQGAIDVVLQTADNAPSGLHRQSLFTERYVLVGRIGHPRLKPRMSVQDFCDLEHVLVSKDGSAGFWGVTDKSLADVGLTRRVALSVPHFLFAISVLASTDLVAMLPSRLVVGRSDVQAVEAPVEVPGYEMVMVWHERVHRDGGCAWLREVFAAAVADPA
jgi:DNA-binding transcriptional LysR family regulator